MIKFKDMTSQRGHQEWIRDKSKAEFCQKMPEKNEFKDTPISEKNKKSVKWPNSDAFRDA